MKESYVWYLCLFEFCLLLRKNCLMLCIFNTSNDAYFNMAVEEYVFTHFSEDIFMLWRNEPAIIVGRFQNSLAEINLDFVKEKGGKNIKFMCLIAAPEGLKRLHEAHPDIQIYVGNLDRELNANAYICPGLGDAGDRIFGTK